MARPIQKDLLSIEYKKLTLKLNHINPNRPTKNKKTIVNCEM